MSGADERRGDQWGGNKRIKGKQIGSDFTRTSLHGNHFHVGYDEVTGASQMADTASIAGRTMFIRCGVHLAGGLVMHGHAGMRHHMGGSLVAFALLRLHGHRCRKRATGEKRQP